MTNSEQSTKDMPMLMTLNGIEPAPSRLAQRARLARRVALAVALAVTAVPMLAQAQKKSPLADAPAIRKRFELRSTRLEIGAGMGSTLDQDFYHTLLVNARLAFHITDWLAIAGYGGFAAANITTGFESNLSGSLYTSQQTLTREPTRNDAVASMDKVNYVLGAQLEFTPFTGKYSLFGKLFAAYDFYLFVGPGFMGVSATNAAGLTPCSSHTRPTGQAPQATDFRCDDSGMKIGANFGVGLHSYFNQWVGLNVELRDVLAQLNPAGRDVNGDQIADGNDASWLSTYVVSANLVIYLPTTAGISP
jgi:outer membrane beta-barrel protein